MKASGKSIMPTAEVQNVKKQLTVAIHIHMTGGTVEKFWSFR